jgi:hypothetical protein
MTALTDPISGLKYGWALGEDNWNTGMDSNLVQLGATINITVLDFVASPVVTTNGTRYIVTTGSGAFAGQDNKLAARVAGAWVFYTLPEGCIVYDEDTNKHYKFEGGSYVSVVDLSGYLTSATAASTYQTQAGMSSYATTSNLTSGLLANLTPTINTQAGASYTLQTADNDGKTILRMTSASANTVEIPSTLTLPISIRQAGTGTTTLVAGSGVTLNGTLAFTAQHQTKTVIPLGSGVYDVVG